MLFGQPVSLVFRSNQWKKKKCFPSDQPAGIVPTMRHSFHSPALTSCGAVLPPGKKYVAVRYLTKELVFFVIDIKSKGQEVFEDACKYLGLQDTELFGLAVIQEDEYIFVDLNLKVSKYASKSWKTTEFGIGGDGDPLLVLYLRVKHYVDFHLLISEKVARHHYYLQMRENVRNYAQTLSEEKVFLLAALALQADLGNYNEQKHKGKYFDVASYFPSWVTLKISDNYIAENIPALHKDNTGLSRGEAQVGYIREASDLTAPHNLNLYRVRRKKGKSFQIVWLGIKDSGITIYEQQDPQKTKSLLSTFLWHDIAKLYFERKKFEILSEGSPECRKFIYYANSEELAKNLLWLCRTTHHFHMSNEARVQELKKLKLDGEKTYRESYIYTDQQDLALEERRKSMHGKINWDFNSSGKEQPEKQKGSGKKPSSGQNGLNSENKCNKKGQKGRAVNSGATKSKNRSMEVLPFVNYNNMITPSTRYKSQSIACFSDHSLVPCSVFAQETQQNPLWSPTSNSSLSTTPTSTLLSRSSCASCTDSACSSLSLTSGSTVKASQTSTCSTSKPADYHWVKCDSFEELSVAPGGMETKSLPHKICISTFKDNHVRTASVYDAVNMPSQSKSSSSASHAALSKQESSPCAPVNDQATSSKSIKQFLQQGSVTQDFAHSNRTGPKKYVMGLNNCNSPSKSKNGEAGSHLYNRTATRIGVSSLSREQRLPLSVFSNHGGRMTACGSEPNLYNSLYSDNGYSSEDNGLAFVESSGGKKRGMRDRKPNSRSELCLSVLGQSIHEINYRQVESNGGDETPDTPGSSDTDVVDNCCENDFPFIPPPPAYRNSTDDSRSDVLGLASRQKGLEMQKARADGHPIPRSVSDVHPELRGSISTPGDVLDLQQLRRKSQALDLPLISALCNDRSLLMLPKTVPTCSRQRHLGNNDPLRFARGYSTAPGGASSTDLNGSYLPVRPVSWHVANLSQAGLDNDSGNLSWYKQNIEGVENNSATKVPVTPAKHLPPTILTSFGKTPERQCSPDINFKSTDYRLNKMQMIPMKLMANNISNGRFHPKGSSS